MYPRCYVTLPQLEVAFMQWRAEANANPIAFKAEPLTPEEYGKRSAKFLLTLLAKQDREHAAKL